MKITREDYYLPYLVCKEDVYFPDLYWQEWPIFGIIYQRKKWKKFSEYGIIICGLQISIVHEYW